MFKRLFFISFKTFSKYVLTYFKDFVFRYFYLSVIDGGICASCCKRSTKIRPLTVKCPKAPLYQLLIYCIHDCCSLDRDGFPGSQHQSMVSVKSLVLAALPADLQPSLFPWRGVWQMTKSQTKKKADYRLQSEWEECNISVSWYPFSHLSKYIFLPTLIFIWNCLPALLLCVCCWLVCMGELIGIRDVSILTPLGPVNNACLVTEGHMQGWISVSENWLVWASAQLDLCAHVAESKMSMAMVSKRNLF